MPIKYPENDNPNMLGGIETDLMYDNVMNHWSWGGMDDLENGIYMDENNRRMVTNIRLQMANLSGELLNENDPERALNVLDEILRGTPQQNVPYTNVLMPVAESYMMIANSDTLKTQYSDLLTDEQKQRALEEAKALTEELVRQAEESVAYSLSLGPEYYVAMEEERTRSLQVCDRLKRLFEYYHPEDEYASELEARLHSLKFDIENYQRNIVDIGSINF